MREEAGMSQRELGERLGKPQSWIHSSEVGTRRVDLAESAGGHNARVCPIWLSANPENPTRRNLSGWRTGRPRLLALKGRHHLRFRSEGCFPILRQHHPARRDGCPRLRHPDDSRDHVIVLGCCAHTLAPFSLPSVFRIDQRGKCLGVLQNQLPPRFIVKERLHVAVQVNDADGSS